MLVLILFSALTLFFVPAKYFFSIGLFLGLIWFPLKTLLIKEDREEFKILAEDSIKQAEHKTHETLDRRVSLVVVFVTSFLFNFFVMLLFWPGIFLSIVYRSTIKEDNE